MKQNCSLLILKRKIHKESKADLRVWKYVLQMKVELKCFSTSHVHYFVVLKRYLRGVKKVFLSPFLPLIMCVCVL